MYSRRRSMRAGHKKGAHYSAPMRLVRIRMALRDHGPFFHAGILTLLVFLGASDLAVPAAPETDARKTEAELQAVKSEIERVTRQVSEEQVERDKLSRELRSAEVSVGRARQGLDEVRRGRA